MAVRLCHLGIDLEEIGPLDHARVLQCLRNLLRAGALGDFDGHVDLLPADRQHVVDAGDGVLRQGKADEQHHHQPHQTEKELVLSALLSVAPFMFLRCAPDRFALRSADVRHAPPLFRVAVAVDDRRLRRPGEALLFREGVLRDLHPEVLHFSPAQFFVALIVLHGVSSCLAILRTYFSVIKISTGLS